MYAFDLEIMLVKIKKKKKKSIEGHDKSETRSASQIMSISKDGILLN